VSSGTEFILCFWLVPAEPMRTYFADLIREVACRFDGPVFEPHVTIYVTRAQGENPETMLQEVLNPRQPYQLAVRGLDYSDKFTKTVFVQFSPDADLARLCEELRRASVSSSDYQLNPHLSLIYKAMDTETKRRLAASITLLFDEVIFDSVKAVISPAEVKSRADVEAWRVIAECRLAR
jgi:2'-5' RNA ligase